MKKIRVIPVVLFKNGRVVQSKGFKIHRPVGTPTVIIDRLSSWNCDEVICLDISRDNKNFEAKPLYDFSQLDYITVVKFAK